MTPSRIVSALVLSFCVCLPVIANASASSGTVTIPFTYVDNRMMVVCTINGQGPFYMVVDTGDPGFTITPEVAQKLAVPVHYRSGGSGAGNNTVRFGTTKLADFSIGALPFKNMEVAVFDLSEIRTKLGLPHLDGSVGYPMFEQYLTFVNVDRSTISLSNRSVSAPANATTTPFSLKGTIPVVAAKIDGIATTAVVDTGDRSSLTLFTPFAKRNGFYGKYPSRPNVITGFGIGGPVRGDVFTLPSLDVLGTRLTGVVTRASRQARGVFVGTDQGGSIGTGLLKRFNIVWDYRHKTIIAWPSKYFRVADVFVPPGSWRRGAPRRTRI
jgi:predicted aspartyl protease